MWLTKTKGSVNPPTRRRSNTLTRRASRALGHLEMDLNSMLRPAKSSVKCGLAMLQQAADQRVSLFQQKSVKGWWPCSCQLNGATTLAVRTHTDTHTHTHTHIYIYI